MKVLVVVDMQNDFITGPLGTKEAQAIVPRVKEKIDEYRKNYEHIIFTRDTHYEDYLDTLEGKKLPVEHCIINTHGWQLVDGLCTWGVTESVLNKETFGSRGLADVINECLGVLTPLEYLEEIELVGLCTDICVVSNALILKAMLPDVEISVDATCCAGVTPETHEAALKTMEMCQINVKRGLNP